MNGTTYDRIMELVAKREVLISSHGYDELAEDHIRVQEVLDSITLALVLEDYPDYPKGPAVLLLQKDHQGEAIHTVWGIPKGATSPAVLITAYRPDPKRWSHDFTRRY